MIPRREFEIRRDLTIWHPEQLLNKNWICVRIRPEPEQTKIYRDVYQEHGEPFQFDSEAEAQRQCDVLKRKK